MKCAAATLLKVGDARAFVGGGRAGAEVEYGLREEEEEGGSSVMLGRWGARRKRRSRAAVDGGEVASPSASARRVTVSARRAMVASPRTSAGERYFRCSGAGSVRLAKGAGVGGSSRAGSAASSRAPSASAVSATKRCSTEEYWFLKNSWIRVLHRVHQYASQKRGKDTHGAAFSGAHATSAVSASWRCAAKSSSSKLSFIPRSAHVRSTAFSASSVPKKRLRRMSGAALARPTATRSASWAVPTWPAVLVLIPPLPIVPAPPNACGALMGVVPRRSAPSCAR